MKDGTRETTNNQWLLKADADKLPATYAELVTLLTGAGLPFGRTLLSDGWTIEPDALNKANLLKDVTAGLYGLTSTAMVDDVLKLAAPKMLLQSYTTAGTYTWTAPDRNGDGSNYEIFVIVVGGGGSGGALKYWYSLNKAGGVNGGCSGFSNQFKMTVTPLQTYTVVVGTGGTSVIAGTGTEEELKQGNNGNSSSFNGVVANGGAGGMAVGSGETLYGLGGRPSDPSWGLYLLKNSIPSAPYWQTPANGDRIAPSWYLNNSIVESFFNPADCMNKITGDILLSAGGSVRLVGTTNPANNIVQNEAITINGLSIGTALWIHNNPVNASAVNPTLYGAGGGACVNTGTTSNTTVTATSGKGADGCVFIYV